MVIAVALVAVIVHIWIHFDRFIGWMLMLNTFWSSEMIIVVLIFLIVFRTVAKQFRINAINRSPRGNNALYEKPHEWYRTKFEPEKPRQV